jgi:hypothetical protein
MSPLEGPTEEDSDSVDLQYRDWSDDEVSTVKSEATDVSDYEDLSRNAEDRAGEYVTFDAVVLQNLDGENYSALLLSLNGSPSEAIYGSWTGDRYIEGDNVTVWAEVLGLETYQTAAVGQRTIPALALADVEMTENEVAT